MSVGIPSAESLGDRMAEQARILVVEDEDEIRDLIALHLRREGHHVDAVGSAEEAEALIHKGSRYDLLALDWMLPGASGVEMARSLRRGRSPELAILMVTARAEADDIVEGLEAGADDYLAKPFDPAVLLARVRALLRRNRRGSTSWAKGLDDPGSKSAADERPDASAEARLRRLGQLTIDVDSYEVRCCGQPLNLTPSEFKLLVALADNRGRVLTRDSLIAQVQGEGVSVVGRTVDTHVFGLRKKLGGCADVIETVRGIGYRVKAETDGCG